MIDLQKFLNEAIRPGQRVAVMGVGSALRSDDAAGMYFIELLGGLIRSKDVLLIAGSTAPENFTGVIKKFAPDRLFIVDAARMGLMPGEARVVPAGDIGGLSCSTHMLPLSVMIGYLEHEARCPVAFFGIQPKSTGPGLELSEEVKEGVRRLAQMFCDAFGAA